MRIQVLSNEAMNSKGYVVLNNGVDWSRFKKNPVLLDEHNSWEQPIGKVTNIELKDGAWVGKLVFAQNAIGKEKEQLYNDGFYNAVSIGGRPTFVERNGRKYAVKWEVFEVSLVAVPANPDAVAKEIAETQKEGLSVEFNAIETETIETLSAFEENILNQYLSSMSEPETNVTEHEEILATEETREQVDNLSVEETEEEKKEKVSMKDAILNAFADAFGLTRPTVKTETEETLSTETEEETTEQLSTEETEEPNEENHTEVEETLTAEEPEKENKKTENERFLKLNHDNINKESRMKDQTNVLEFLHTGEGKNTLRQLGDFLTLSNEEIAKPEHRSAMELASNFAALCATDRDFMGFMGNVTFDVDGGKRETLHDTMQKLAAGANSRNFIENTPDLAKIVWSSMIYRLLFPSNSWANRIRRVSGEGKQGLIWVESKADPAIYFGNRAPLNAPNYMYDDLAVGLVEKVFSLQPMLWQPSNTDLLVYNDRALGQSEALRKMTAYIHNYALQQFAEGAYSWRPMSGDAFDTANMFPANPNAAGQAHGLTYGDLQKLTTMFVNQNYEITEGGVDIVMDAIFNEQLQANPTIAAILSGQLRGGSIDPAYIRFQQFNITPRSTTSLYDTATNAVIDPELYKTQDVADDGTIQPVSPPVLPSTAYGVALAIMPSEAIIAMGNTHVHMVSDPNNYGWKMSMDVRFGARVGRSDGKGVVGLYPAAV